MNTKTNYIVVCRQEVLFNSSSVIDCINFVNNTRKTFPNHNNMRIFGEVFNGRL